MEKYELLYILPAKHTEAELDDLAKKVKEIVTTSGGQVAEEHAMGKRKLAYPIKQVRYGHYYLVIFTAEEPVIAKLNATLRLTTELLRHLIVMRDPHIQGVPKLKEEDSIVQKRVDRDKGPTSRRRGPQAGGRFRTTGRDRAAETADAVQAKRPAAKPEEKLSIEELDKKLDKILTDDIL